MSDKMTKPKNKQFFSIDESVGLHKNYSFRLAILLPVAISVILIIIFTVQLALKGQFWFSFSQPGVTAFVKYFTFPISLLSLSIVFGVMVARFHSSKQKAKSNEITERNNSVNYFYKTHEEFEKFCMKLISSTDNGFKGIKANICYEAMFDSSSPKAPSLFVGDNFFRSIESYYSVYIDNLVNYLGSDDFKLAISGTKLNSMGPKHNFSKGLKAKLERLGLEFDWIGYTTDLNIEKDLKEFYESIFELFSFPGLENKLKSREKLNDIHKERILFLKAHPKYIEFIGLQTPQS
ncbi:hypothetical protein L1D46_05345 [Pseudoalteromonas sp. Isolate3]|uniref:hypothetical protein n=1 Tax=Pseudoalteromonas sp. Isolate3 TaxID=2908526 RepID=UPI001EFD5A2E|nr:hypothetical protein [Pseudoalteromonas sp. Isolate3]MCG9708225.1 hypothetical protein [Pseudoalteromonas sp. Isolate3]